MSEVTTNLVWYPPEFPVQGRLPSKAALVGKNCKQQESLERTYRNELCQAENKLVDMPCCKTLQLLVPSMGLALRAAINGVQICSRQICQSVF